MERTIIIECQSCLGTGLVKKKGHAACECHHCNGTGKTEFTYNEFEGRKKMEGITRVFPYCPSLNNRFLYMDKDCKKDGQTLHFSQYGCTYEEWLKGKKANPMEELYCPAQFCLGNTNNIKTENAPCSRCVEGFEKGICYCSYYDDKSKCWKEWHKKTNKLIGKI